MTASALTLVLFAALLHALWNLAAKNVSGDPTIFVWLHYSASAVLLLPVVVWQWNAHGYQWGWELFVGPAVSAVLHIAYAVLLQRGYKQGDLGVVYPVARGLGPTLTVVAAVAFFGEAPATLALLGGLVVIGGILVVTGKTLFQRTAGLRTGLFYGAATGAAIAGYTLWDDFSVNQLALAPIVYFGIAQVLQSALMLPWVWSRRTRMAATWSSDRREVAIVAALSPMAYLLVLYALTSASVAVVAPVRESSIVVGSLMAWWLFSEPDPVRRVSGAAIVACGITLVAIA